MTSERSVGAESCTSAATPRQPSLHTRLEKLWPQLSEFYWFGSEATGAGGETVQKQLSVVWAVDVAQVSAGRKHPAASGLPSHLYRVTCWPVAVCAELAVTHLKRWNYVKIMRCTGCSCSCHYSDRSVIFQPQTETNYLQLLTEAEQKHSELRLLTNNHQLSWTCNVKLLVTKPERSFIWLYDENIVSRL